MVIKFDENDPLLTEEPVPPKRNPSVQCVCGRFAKHLRTRHHYNGTWDLITIDVLCSRCGETSIECV